ncbi:hypothetical protein D3C81_2031840 [compost metagenome]
MREVIARLVEQAVAQAPAYHHADHAQEQDVLDVLARPGLVARERRKGRMAQAFEAQQQKQAESGQIGQPVPMHGQGADLQGDGIDVRIDQHAGDCAV